MTKKKSTAPDKTSALASIASKIDRTAAVTGICALGLGLVLGRVAFGTTGVPGVTNVNSTTVESAQTGEIIATYTYKGKAHGISIQDILDYAGASATDGEYNTPSAETIMAYIRNQIANAEAKAKGFTATDGAVTDFVSNYYGYDSVDEFAEALNLDASQVKTLLADTVAQQLLRDDVTGTTLVAPDAPTEPEEGEEDTATADYATYITNLVGDEWDEAAGTWADAEGDYATATTDYEITNDSASYNAAMAVYRVAYNAYTTQYQALTEVYNDYLNELYKTCTVSIGTAIQ